MATKLSREEFLDKKRDYSPLLVHLTKDEVLDKKIILRAEHVLHMILTDKKLRAYNHFCLFNDELDLLDEDIRNKFKVVCFTETPIDQIDILLERVQGRNIVLAPYGLVFTKAYIRQQGGNPVFYAAGNLFDPLWELYKRAKLLNFSVEENKVLALVNRCDEQVDFHWEREWRIVDDLEFSYDDIYCGLCPKSEIAEFEYKYEPIVFIDPYWGINKILNKLVEKWSPPF